jgi:dihydrodipicolinate reductase
MNIVIIDGQGGKMGKMIVEQLKRKNPDLSLTAIGTNSIATAAMMKAGADQGATGENPVVVACKDANIIIGPIGIVIADSMLGEVTPKMAKAIGQSKAEKILIPVNKCNNHIVGFKDYPLSEYIKIAIEMAESYIL